jgi:hypothetical protein
VPAADAALLRSWAMALVADELAAEMALMGLFLGLALCSERRLCLKARRSPVLKQCAEYKGSTLSVNDRLRSAN